MVKIFVKGTSGPSCLDYIYFNVVLLVTLRYDPSTSYIIHVVARIALVKPEKARGVEDVILRAAQMGQIVEKVALCFLLIIFGLNICICFACAFK